MSKSTPQKTIDVNPLSVCDVMRDNTNQVIMKIESLLPTYIESFADLQSEGLRIARDFFGTCYIAEKELLDSIGVDQKAIETFDKYAKAIAKTTIFEIDMINSFQKTFAENIMSTMKSYDDCVKIMLSSYSKMLDYAMVAIPKKN